MFINNELIDTNNKKLATMNPRHHRMLDLFLKGWTVGAVAKELNMTNKGVSIVFNSPTFQHQLAIRRMKLEAKLDDKLSATHEDVNNKLKQRALDAANRIGMLVDSDDEGIALRSAQDILDRTDHPRQTRTDNKNLSAVVVLKPEDLRRLEQTIFLDNDEVSDGEKENIENQEEEIEPADFIEVEKETETVIGAVT